MYRNRAVVRLEIRGERDVILSTEKERAIIVLKRRGALSPSDTGLVNPHRSPRSRWTEGPPVPDRGNLPEPAFAPTKKGTGQPVPFFVIVDC